MKTRTQLLTDSFGRMHNYLRISLTERCNLRCTYCMPAEGIVLSPKEHIMTYEEIYEIAKVFVAHGVDKIRLTGGEPLVRKDVREVFKKLASLPVELAITTNGILVDRFVEDFKKYRIRKINVSLDSLENDKNNRITRRNFDGRALQNILMLLKEGFEVKVNCVLMKGFNEDEIVDFISLTEKNAISMRFIEFMPFDGNHWNLEKMVSMETILKIVTAHFGEEKLLRLKDAENDTAKNYKIAGYKGEFAIISSVTNPFCDSCNRIRLLADGKLKNCLFSTQETDLLKLLRAGQPIEPIIEKVIQSKMKKRSGMESLADFQHSNSHGKNRSMTTIGG